MIANTRKYKRASRPTHQDKSVDRTGSAVPPDKRKAQRRKANKAAKAARRNNR